MPLRSAGAPSIRDNRAAQRRPRTEDRGFLGNDGDDRDPIAPRGLLDQAMAAIGENPIRTGGGREVPDRDERPGRGPADPEDAPPPLLPGDPSNLGARGRRRRNSDDDDASPVLRRGLLGV